MKPYFKNPEFKKYLEDRNIDWRIVHTLGTKKFQNQLIREYKKMRGVT